MSATRSSHKNYVRKCFDAMGGPETLPIIPGATHQLMLCHTDIYIPLVDDSARRRLVSTAVQDTATPNGEETQGAT